MPHCSKISKNVSKKSEFTLRKLEKIVKIEQVLHKRHLTIFSFINDYSSNDRYYGHLIHCEKLIACFFYCFVQPKTIIWNRFWPRWHFMQIWLHHFRCHQKLSLVIFGQTFRLYFPSNYLHDWICIEACDDDIKKWLQNHRSTKKKRSFSLERKSWVFSARGAFFDCFWGFAGFLHIVHTVAKSNFLSKNSILFIRHWIWILAPQLELFRGVDFLEQKVVFCHSVHQ